MAHLDLLHADQEKTKQRTERKENTTGLEDVVSGAVLRDLPHFTGLQCLVQPLLATTGNPGSCQGEAQGLVFALDKVELFVSLLPPGVLQAQLEPSSLLRQAVHGLRRVLPTARLEVAEKFLWHLASLFRLLQPAVLATVSGLVVFRPRPGARPAPPAPPSPSRRQTSQGRQQ